MLLVTCGEHTLVIVNREGCLYDMQTWGDDTFIIDIWSHNQYDQHILLDGVYWTYDLSVFQFLFEKKLMRTKKDKIWIDITLRDHL